MTKKVVNKNIYTNYIKYVIDIEGINTLFIHINHITYKRNIYSDFVIFNTHNNLLKIRNYYNKIKPRLKKTLI